MHAASADRVIHTSYCYGSFSLWFKLINLTRFILELMTKLTLSQRKKYVQHTNQLACRCFRESSKCRVCTIKILPGVDTGLTGDYKIRAKDGLEMFKNYTRNFSNF